MSTEPKTFAPDDDPLTGHCYDGIQEYDNPTPGWWNWLFVLSIIWSPIYLVWFHSPVEERTLAAQFDRNLAANMQLQFGEIGDLTPDEPTLVKYMAEDRWLKVGAATFATNCASCHGKDGEGKTGPNLTDNFYKPTNVKQLTDIALTIQNGAAAGAMPSWRNKLHPNEVVLVAAYVANLRGKNLPGRQVEGNEVPPWPTAAAKTAAK